MFAPDTVKLFREEVCFNGERLSSGGEDGREDVDGVRAGRCDLSGKIRLFHFIIIEMFFVLSIFLTTR